MPFSLKKGLRFTALATCVLTAPISAFQAHAEQVRIRAVGTASYVSDALASSFKIGDKAMVFLTYDTGAPLVETSGRTVMIAQDAVSLFAITDAEYNFHISYNGPVGGVLRVTDGGEEGDGFGFRSFSNVLNDQSSDTNLRGPDRGGEPLLSAGITFASSSTDVTKLGEIPANVGDITTDWTTTKPWFYLQFCGHCGAGLANRSSVSFEIDFMQTYALTDPLLTFSPVANELVARGEIDVQALRTFAQARKDHPKADTLLLAYVPGSNNDDANAVFNRQVREANLNTRVPGNGLIASGGVDLFLSGVKRTLGAGACVGVHSWSDDSVEGSKLPRNDKRHEPYLKAMRSMGIDEDFYWFTLEKANADSMYYVTAADLAAFNVTTAPAPRLGTQAECETRTAP